MKKVLKGIGCLVLVCLLCGCNNNSNEPTTTTTVKTTVTTTEEISTPLQIEDCLGKYVSLDGTSNLEIYEGGEDYEVIFEYKDIGTFDGVVMKDENNKLYIEGYSDDFKDVDFIFDIKTKTLKVESSESPSISVGFEMKFKLV